MIRASLK